jgi:transposase-like protein
MMTEPTTLLEAVRLFKDPNEAQRFFASLRWPNGMACPREGCGSADVREIGGRVPRWFCKDCKKEFTAKVGTIFEDSPIGFDKWLPAIWLLTSAKNGVSSMELHRSLGVTQKTAWFMLHRVRLALSSGTFTQLRGHVEADETFIGGRLRNLRRSPHGRQNSGTKGIGPKGKAPVLGIVEREGEARAFAVEDVKKRSLVPTLLKHIDPNATLYTDSLRSYQNLHRHFARHEIVNHAFEYVRGNAHVNTVECFWSVLKRTLAGTYVCARPKHIGRYLDEHTFRFNSRRSSDGARFAVATKGADKKRLTYKALIGKS